MGDKMYFPFYDKKREARSFIFLLLPFAFNEIIVYICKNPLMEVKFNSPF